jgi:hypothetical protein
MILTKKDIEGILQAEIVWCLDHPDATLNHDQQMGFVNGLRQAQLILRRAQDPRYVRVHYVTPEQND